MGTEDKIETLIESSAEQVAEGIYAASIAAREKDPSAGRLAVERIRLGLATLAKCLRIEIQKGPEVRL